jgi:hypothetical protein
MPQPAEGSPTPQARRAPATGATGRIFLSEAEFWVALHDFQRSAFRLELQPDYREPGETDLADAWLAGEQVAPETDPGLAEWFRRVREHVAAGRTVSRIRVHEDPPSDYQRWERWLGRWNAAAGETIRYLTRAQAYEIGLLPHAGKEDWWLYDDTRLLVMRFAGSRRVQNEIITDRAIVHRACEWRDLAVRHGALDDHRADRSLSGDYTSIDRINAPDPESR